MASATARLRGNLAAAISYAEECLILDREGGNEEYISSSLNNIAGLYMTYGDADAARKYIDEAIEIERKLDRSAYLAIRYGVASEIYLKSGEARRQEFSWKWVKTNLDKEKLLTIAKSNIPSDFYVRGE